MITDDPTPDGTLGAMMRNADTATQQATDIYAALVTTGQLHTGTGRLLTYRCSEHRCALAHVFEVPTLGTVIGVPRHRTSPTETAATSNPAGRANHTEDGARRWVAHAAPVDLFADPVVACDHLRSVTIPRSAILADWNAHQGAILVRRDGKRHAETRR